MRRNIPARQGSGSAKDLVTFAVIEAQQIWDARMALKHADAAEVVELLSFGEQRPLKTAAIVKSGHFEAVRLVVNAGTEIPPHHVDGPITLQCLSGHAILGIKGKDLALRPGEWTYLEGGVRHWVKGVEDAVLLLTIIFTK